MKRGITANRGSVIRQFDPGAGTRDGSGADHWSRAGATPAFSGARVVPVADCASQFWGDLAYDDSVICRACEPEDSAEAWEIFLRAADGARGAWNYNGNRGIVRVAGGGNERAAAEIPDHSVQAVDANAAGALVGGARFGNCDVSALVCTPLNRWSSKVASLSRRKVAI